MTAQLAQAGRGRRSARERDAEGFVRTAAAARDHPDLRPDGNGHRDISARLVSAREAWRLRAPGLQRVEVAVVDPESQPVEPGEIGEVVARGGSLMSCYYNGRSRRRTYFGGATSGD